MFVFESCPGGPLGPLCHLVGGLLVGITFFGMLRLATAVLLHRLRSKRDTVPHMRLFEEIERVTRDNTLYSSRVPSPAVWRKRRPYISNDSDAIAEAAELLEALGDRFASVKPPLHKSEAVEEQGSVRSSILGNIGYVRIERFCESVPSEVEKFLGAMTNVAGLILDLRNNHGGTLMSAVRTAALFLKRGTVLNIERQDEYKATSFSAVPSISLTTQFVVKNLVTETRPYSCPNSNDLRNKIEKRLPYWLNGRPLVILVNEETASAAEMFVGALKDSDEAVKLVGRSTYGKGVIQVQFPILDKAVLWLTTHRFTTPSGYWPGDGASKRHGLKPHIVTMKTAENDSKRCAADAQPASLTDVSSDADVQLCLQLIERMLIKQALAVTA